MIKRNKKKGNQKKCSSIKKISIKFNYSSKKNKDFINYSSNKMKKIKENKKKILKDSRKSSMKCYKNKRSNLGFLIRKGKIKKWMFKNRKNKVNLNNK